MADSTPIPIPDRAAARGQTGLSLLVFAVFIAAIAVAHLAVSSDDMLLGHRIPQWKSSKSIYMDKRFFDSPDERLLYGLIPAANYSRGGIYFIGASPIQVSLMTWNFPAAEQKFVGNYSLSAMTHSEEDQYLHYLVDSRELLAAGGEKNEIVIELFFGDTGHESTPSYEYGRTLWKSYFLRHDVYAYDDQRGISLIPMPAWKRQLRLENIHIEAFWTTMDKIATGQNLDYISFRPRLTPSEYRDYWSAYLGVHWQSGMDIELAHLSSLIDYLHARHASVATIFMPLGSWFNDFPPAARYRTQVLAMLASKSVPIVDLVNAVPDEDFVDSVHLGYKGAEKIQPAYVDMVHDHLQRIGELPR